MYTTLTCYRTHENETTVNNYGTFFCSPWQFSGVSVLTLSDAGVVRGLFSASGHGRDTERF